MRTPYVAIAIAGILFVVPAHAQRGAGESVGIAQRIVKTQLVKLSGKIRRIDTDQCELRTVQPRDAPLGTHMILKTEDGKKLNVHLGPTQKVAFVVDRLEKGRTVTVEAFRTENLKKDHYVARSVKVDDNTLHLRDENLRPVWAGGRRALDGQRAPMGARRGGGRMRGYGRAWR